MNNLREALEIAEAALADIGDADREPGDDLAWCERRAAQALPLVRAALSDRAVLAGKQYETDSVNQAQLPPTPPAATAEPSEPEGWKLVPLMPTDEMVQRMRDQNMCGSMDNLNAWQAAWYAAPEPKP